MIDYEHCNSFTLKDPITKEYIDLRDDLDGRIININDEVYERECMPEVNFITDKNENEDGETFIKSTYGVRTIDMTIFLENGGSDLFRFKRFVNKKYQQLFQWDNYSEMGIWVVEKGDWKSQVYYGKRFNGKVNLKFVAHDPYYHWISDYTTRYNNVQINQQLNISYNSNTKSFPLLKITPNGTQPVIQFKWNNLIVTLTNVDQEIYLDCEKERCYQMNNGVIVLQTFKYNSDSMMNYPTLEPILHNIVTLLQGNIQELYVERRTRII